MTNSDYFKHFCPKVRIDLDQSTTIHEYDCYIGIYSPLVMTHDLNVTGNGEIYTKERIPRVIFVLYLESEISNRDNYGAKSRVLNKFLNEG